MNRTVSWLRKMARLGAAAVGLLAAVGFSQDETATVSVTVNVDATVIISPPANSEVGIGATANVAAGETAQLTLQLTAPRVSVSHRARKQAAAGAQVTAMRAGSVSLKLNPQQYSSADISLHSLNGKRIMRGKAAASKGAQSVTRQNVAAGVYLLSAKGVNGSAFSTRLTHRGGRLNINIAFDGAGSLPSLRKQAKAAADYGEWTVTVIAAGHTGRAFTFQPAEGENKLPGGGSVTLPVSDLVLEEGEAWIGELSEEGITLEMAAIFNADGTMKAYAKVLEMWISPEEEEEGVIQTWYTVGDKIYSVYTDSYESDTTEITYSVSGATLYTIDEDDYEITFTKQPFEGVTVVERDTRLVNTYWANMTSVSAWMFSIEAGIGIAMNFEGTMEEPQYYSWRTSGGNLILTPIVYDYDTFLPQVAGNDTTYAYTISGETLTVNGKSYTKFDMDDDWGDWDDDDWDYIPLTKSRLSAAKQLKAPPPKAELPKAKLPGRVFGKKAKASK